LEGRLAPSADAGFMSPELVAGWVGAAKGLYDDKPQMQRDEALHLELGRFYMPPKCMGSARAR
jgi:hypothetical protein